MVSNVKVVYFVWYPVAAIASCLTVYVHNMSTNYQQGLRHVIQKNYVNKSQGTDFGDLRQGFVVVAVVERISHLACFAYMKENSMEVNANLGGKCHFTSNSDHRIRSF